jgi:GTPase SAR1 family protein
MANASATKKANYDDDYDDVGPDFVGGHNNTVEGDDDDQAYYHWSKRNGVFRPIGHTQDTVPAGIYEIDNDNSGWFLSKVKFPSDALLRLPGMPIDFILDQIDTFWKREELFTQTKLLHKRGILMFGPAGCGKTSIIRLLCDDIVRRDGIVIMVTNCRLAETALGGIRQIETRRPILTIIEDIETFMGPGDESSSARALLALLDGETQVDHIVHLACPAPETKILKTDLTWCRADSLVIGDELIGFDEEPASKGLIGARKFRTTKVIACPIITKKRYRVTTTAGEETVSEFHPFLVKLGGRQGVWRTVEDLKPGNRICFIGLPWETNNPKLKKAWEGVRVQTDCVKVIKVECIGDGPVVGLGTSTKTFIGEGMLQHNTTNKPEQLEDRIVKRPGRFDLVVGLNHPVEEARRAYLFNLLHEHVTPEELQIMVDETEGLGLAHLRELVVANYCLGLDRKETLKRLKKNFKKSLKVKKSPSEGMGFTTTFAIDDEDEKSLKNE